MGSRAVEIDGKSIFNFGQTSQDTKEEITIQDGALMYICYL
jgi:hypothetical protein